MDNVDKSVYNLHIPDFWAFSPWITFVERLIKNPVPKNGVIFCAFCTYFVFMNIYYKIVTSANYWVDFKLSHFFSRETERALRTLPRQKNLPLSRQVLYHLLLLINVASRCTRCTVIDA